MAGFGSTRFQRDLADMATPQRHPCPLLYNQIGTMSSHFGFIHLKLPALPYAPLTQRIGDESTARQCFRSEGLTRRCAFEATWRFSQFGAERRGRPPAGDRRWAART